MKILIAVHHFPPRFHGGAEWRAYRTARGLQREGHQVRVLCVESTADGGEGEIAFQDTAYSGIPVRRLYFDLSRSPDPFRWSFRNPFIGKHVSNLMNEFEADVFHLIGGYLITGNAIESAQAARVPVVVTLTDFWFLCPRITLMRSDGTLCRTIPTNSLECLLCLCKERRRYRLPDRLLRDLLGHLLLRFWELPGALSIWGQSELVQTLQERRAYLLYLLSSVDVVISPSRFLRDLFTAQGVRPRRFLHCRQGLDLRDWAPVKPMPDDSLLRIGYIGQIAKHKGVDVLVKAFCQLRVRGKRPQLLLYGDLEQFPTYVRQIQRQVAGRDDITLAGRFDNARIGEVHAGLDVLVVPSVWYENSPNVILEAFAAGTPVVVSNLGGMAELVQHEVNGLRFKMGDVDDLARQLQRLVDQPDLLESFRQNLPPIKTAAQEVAELIQIYQLMMEEGNS